MASLASIDQNDATLMLGLQQESKQVTPVSQEMRLSKITTLALPDATTDRPSVQVLVQAYDQHCSFAISLKASSYGFEHIIESTLICKW